MSELSLLNGPDDSEKALLTGCIEKIIFHNEDNGYTVFRLIPEAKSNIPQEAVGVVGHMGSPQAGVRVTVRGKWVTNARFGRQVQLESYEEIMPASTEGIRLYLASGLIKGVRSSLANRIVDAFGTDTIRVLDEEPDRLLDIAGVGRKSLVRIKEAWAEHRGIRELMLFLQPHGITAAYAVRIYKHYGAQSLDIVKENPYSMAMDIHGIGFVTADATAAKLGFGREHPLRAQAGMLYTLRKLNDDGHVYVPRDKLVSLTADQLDIPYDMVEDSIASLEMEERIVREDMDGEEGIFLSRFYHYESKTAFYLQRLLRSPKSVRFPDAAGVVAKVVSELNIELAPEQLQAVHTATQSKIMVLTGGPGTGKTTIINAILKVFAEVGAKILLAAPTGRAAKRMAETSGRESKTIHRLLEYSPKEDGFARNENNPLACALLVVDEASMMDTMLLYHLLKAAPLGATLLFVGDVYQLPSVGPGNVLKDIIASGVVPVVELTEIFRQSAESAIICNAHLINKGEVPALESSKDRLSDFYFIRQNDPEKVADLIVDLVKNHIPRRFHLDSVDDIQVLTPMHKGAAGSANLNVRLQQALNTQTRHLQRGDRKFFVHDKVMQIRNNYDKDVFNGDIGRIILLDTEERTLTVRYDERNVPYDWDELDEIVPAYAISIHKSQGSEYPAVVIPLMVQHYMLLQRNLVYTGVTRGKKLVILVGESKAFHMAVNNNRMYKRHTRLARRLAGEGAVPLSAVPAGVDEDDYGDDDLPFDD